MATREPAVAGAQSLLRALDILECFTEDDPMLSLAAISERTSLKSPTTHRLLKALASRDLVVSDRGHYSLGPGLLRLTATVMRSSSDLTTAALPAMERMRTGSEETVSVHRLIGESRICTAELVSRNAIRMESGVGQVYPLHAGAAGKVILAFLDGERAEYVIDEAGAHGIRDLAAFREELAQIRAQGWATSDNEVVPGAASLAVPIFGRDGVVGAINVSGPANRWTTARRSKFRPEAVRETETITAQLRAGPVRSG